MERDSPHSTFVLIVGVGNEYRGDDAIGLLAARRIRALNLPGVSTIECRGEASGLVNGWKDVQAVFVIDAVYSGQKTGTIHQWNVTHESLPVDLFSASSHSLGVAQAIELARAMNLLPPVMIVYGIEAKQFDYQTGVSPELYDLLDEMIQQIQSEVSMIQNGEPRATP